MRNLNVKLLKVIVLILLLMNVSGCWNRRELNTLGIVMGIGVDKPIESGKVQITAQIVKPGEIGASRGKDEGGGSTEAFWNAENTGESVFSTLRDFTNKSSRKLFFPHNQVLIFGRSIAEEGVQKYIDFFVRDPETRVNVWVLVSQSTAAEVLDVKPQLEKIPANNIARLVKGEAAATSQTRAVRLRDFALGLMSQTTAPTAPFIEVTGEGDKKTAMIAGTAVFKGDKLVGKMNKLEGRGLLWVLGEVKSGIINVKGPENDVVSLEIIRANSKVKPEITDEGIKMKISILEEGNIAEQSGPENLAPLAEVALLEKRKAEVIRGEILAAVRKAQALNTDVFGFGDSIHQKYPKQWKEMEGNWDEIFPTISVQVNVEAKLRLMGKISKPAAPEQEKK